MRKAGRAQFPGARASARFSVICRAALKRPEGAAPAGGCLQSTGVACKILFVAFVTFCLSDCPDLSFLAAPVLDRPRLTPGGGVSKFCESRSAGFPFLLPTGLEAD